MSQSGNEKPRADRTETGFTLGGPIKKDKIFFFGGYQYTDANTGLVPTARTRTVLPLAMTVLGADRSKAAIAAAFNQFNGCTVGTTCLLASDVSDVAFRIFNLRNPVTGGFYLPSITNFRNLGIVDQTGTGSFQFGNVSDCHEPHAADEIIRSSRSSVFSRRSLSSINLRRGLTDNSAANNTLSGTFFYSNFPGLDSFPDPNSLASPTTLQRNDRNRTLSIGDTHIFSPNLINEVRFGYFSLNNTRSLTEEFSTGDFTNAAIGVTNPASIFDSSVATTRLGHYIGRNNIANFSFGGPNDSFNRRKQVTFSIADNVDWITGRTQHQIRRRIQTPSIPHKFARRTGDRV